MLKTVIIDDEESARETLKELVQSFCPQVEIIGETDSVQSGIELINTTQPQLVFLDIQMNEGTGFDLLDAFRKPFFYTVFTTAYDQFALKAIKYNGIDYLLKPIDPKELIKAIQKVKKVASPNFTSEQLDLLLEGVKRKRFEKIALNTLDGLCIFKLKDIIRLESDGNYTTFHVKGEEKVVVSKNIKEFSEILPQESFARPHQSHMVNLDRVKKILKEDGGYILTEDNAKVPISRRRKDYFMDLITKRSLN